MNMNELNEEELDMVNGGGLWSVVKQFIKTVPIGTLIEIVKGSD